MYVRDWKCANIISNYEIKITAIYVSELLFLILLSCQSECVLYFGQISDAWFICIFDFKSQVATKDCFVISNLVFNK